MRRDKYLQKDPKQCIQILPLQEVGLTFHYIQMELHSNSHFSLLWTWARHSDVLPKNKVGKGLSSISPVDNLGKHCLNQGMANITVMSYGYHVHPTWYNEKGTLPLWCSFPKTITSIQAWEKTSETQIEGPFYRPISLYF